jgi:DNA-binding NarL/FixJ family response regulator
MIGYASVSGALRAGAIGYLAKDAHPSELGAAIKAAAAGQFHLSPPASSALLDALRMPESPESLTGRENEVLDLLALGKTNRDIAQHLHVTEDTVKTHVRHILAKLKVQSRTQAILAAFRLGLVARDPGIALPFQ